MLTSINTFIMWDISTVYNDETSSVTSKKLAGNLPMVRSLLTYLSLVLVSLWLTKVVYLQTSIQNLRTNSNIYSIHLTIPYILKEPFLSVQHSVYDVSVLPMLRLILALLNLPLTSLNEVTTITSSPNKYDAPPTSPATSLYKPKTSTNLTDACHLQLHLIHHFLTSPTLSKNITICYSLLTAAKKFFRFTCSSLQALPQPS